MGRDVGVHRADDRHVIDVLGDFGKDFADFDAGPAIALKFEWRRHGHAALADGLAVVFGQGRLGVPSIDLRGRACGKNVDDPFGLGGQGRDFGRQRRQADVRITGKKGVLAEEGGQAQGSETHAKT